MNWLERKLESLRYWADLFNQAVSEKNNDGASEAWNMAREVEQEILDWTGWTKVELLSKY